MPSPILESAVVSVAFVDGSMMSTEDAPAGAAYKRPVGAWYAMSHHNALPVVLAIAIVAVVFVVGSTTSTVPALYGAQSVVITNGHIGVQKAK